MRLIVVYAIALHTTWALCLLIDPAAAGATAMFSAKVLGAFAGAMIYLAVSAMALMSLSQVGVWRPLLMLPQQTLLVMSSIMATQAMWMGHFADGVARSHFFIIADQSPAVIAMAIHTYAVVLAARRELVWR